MGKMAGLGRGMQGRIGCKTPTPHPRSNEPPVSRRPGLGSNVGGTDRWVLVNLV